MTKHESQTHNLCGNLDYNNLIQFNKNVPLNKANIIISLITFILNTFVPIFN